MSERDRAVERDSVGGSGRVCGGGVRLVADLSILHASGEESRAALGLLAGNEFLTYN